MRLGSHINAQQPAAAPAPDPSVSACGALFALAPIARPFARPFREISNLTSKQTI